MPNTESMTLSRLLALKLRREQSQRAALATLVQHEAELLQNKTRLLDERRHLWDEWRSCSAASHVLDHRTLRDLKIELANYSQHDHAIADRLDTMQTEWSRMQLEKAERQALLRKLMVEQEKLKMLLE
ncbi:hypothetical protein [Pseudomonas sp. 6D_7.1_Bac1]|jgi:hypothetical protein|uniref:hypothetical protein n=1 Tax=Pseudomonas sp. 6D_7.1_Bac1 TaxID=2971615 RepID=UPI0021CA16BF|nr:hypothetical protein [Pseudomonas sp. 6D_7.1_Bac1]MCU1748799.1 hypothetical protein [Pseudomonas sp. 6D_7.1_Bac1]